MPIGTSNFSSTFTPSASFARSPFAAGLAGPPGGAPIHEQRDEFARVEQTGADRIPPTVNEEVELEALAAEFKASGVCLHIEPGAPGAAAAQPAPGDHLCAPLREAARRASTAVVSACNDPANQRVRVGAAVLIGLGVFAASFAPLVAYGLKAGNSTGGWHYGD